MVNLVLYNTHFLLQDMFLATETFLIFAYAFIQGINSSLNS